MAPTIIAETEGTKHLTAGKMKKNASKRPEWCKKTARDIETNAVGVDGAPEVVLAATYELNNYVEEDVNEFNLPKFIKYREDWSSDDYSSAPPPRLLKRDNSDEETCSEATIAIKEKLNFA